MRKVLYTLIATFIFSGTLLAQGKQSIVDEINSSKSGEGSVKVYQDETIANVLGKYQTADSSKGASNFVKVMGFKIQIYSGNDQSKSKAEAESKASLVRKDFPDMEVTISYQAPTWLVRAGNFLTQEEADAALALIKEKQPGLAREMYVVRSTVKRPSF